MANCTNLFKLFNNDLNITKTKNEKLNISHKNLRKKIKKYFEENHESYIPKFYTQGSVKMGTTIRTKDDTCDLDDGVYFKDNPDDISGTTLQAWVKDAVDGTTDAIPSHRKKCITVDYKAGYNIDIPVFLFDKTKDTHPSLAVKNGDWQEDDPKEFFDEFNNRKDKDNQTTRIVRYLKAWCDYKDEKMPSGLVMTVLTMDNLQKNERDDVSLKFTLIEIERELKKEFTCKMPTTPKNDLLKNYDPTKQANFLKNLADFIADAKSAVDVEKNQLKASKLWQNHLGDKFPDGEDTDETSINTSLLSATIGTARPYFGSN